MRMKQFDKEFDFNEIKFDPISDDIRDKLHWLPVEQRIQFKIGVLVYRCLHGNAPSYISEMLTAAADVSGRRSLRSAARGDLVIPPHQNSWIWLKDVRRLWSIFLELTFSRTAGHQPD